MNATTPGLSFMVRSHIAQLLNVNEKTVSYYIELSKPGGRLADDPVPEPTGYLDTAAPEGWVKPEQRRPGLRPFWSPDTKDDWLAWRDRHPGRPRRKGVLT